MKTCSEIILCLVFLLQKYFCPRQSWWCWKSQMKPFYGSPDIYAADFASWYIAKLSLLLNGSLLSTEVTTMDFGPSWPLMPFLPGFRGWCAAGRPPPSRRRIVFILGREIVSYMFFMQQNCFVIGLEHGINGILPFLVIFCHLGVHSQPPGTQQFLPSLDSHSHPTSD